MTTGGETRIVTLSRSCVRQRAQDHAQPDAGILARGDARRAGLRHRLGAVEQRAEVDAEDRRGDQAEVRERRVAPADVRGLRNVARSFDSRAN